MNKILKKIKTMILGTSDRYADKYPDLTLVKIDIGGKWFWKFADDTMMPTMRAGAYMRAIEQFDTRICHEDIDFFCDNVEQNLTLFINSQKDGQTLKAVKNLDNIEKLVQVMRAKNKLGLNIDTIYHLATVLFLQENENPHEYDPELQKDKLKHFKEHGQYFFYNSHVKDFLPKSLTSLDYYQNYIQMLMEEEQKITAFRTRLQS